MSWPAAMLDGCALAATLQGEAALARMPPALREQVARHLEALSGPEGRVRLAAVAQHARGRLDEPTLASLPPRVQALLATDLPRPRRPAGLPRPRRRYRAAPGLAPTLRRLAREEPPVPAEVARGEGRAALASLDEGPSKARALAACGPDEAASVMHLGTLAGASAVDADLVRTALLIGGGLLTERLGAAARARRELAELRAAEAS